MTSLAEKEVKRKYWPEEKEFLTNPYRAKYMTKFTIGSNKLELYGYPLVMAKKSTLIESLLPKDPPFELLTFGICFEAPMEYLWLYLNNVSDHFSYLNLQEFFQLYRLMNYFDIPKDSNIFSDWLSSMQQVIISSIKTEEDKKIVLENKEIIAKVFNSLKYKNKLKPFVEYVYYNIPELMDLLDVVPVIIDEGKVLTAIVSREALTDREVLEPVLDTFYISPNYDEEGEWEYVGGNPTRVILEKNVILLPDIKQSML